MDNMSEGSDKKKGELCCLNNNRNINREILTSPKLLDKFMMNSEREIIIDPEKHLYLKREYSRNECSVNFDLNEGIENFDHFAFNEGLLPILQYIKWKANQLDVNDLNKIIDNADIVCCRGTMTRIASSSYDSTGGWKCLIEKFNNVLFVREMDTDEKIESENTAQYNKSNYWGHKFESYLFAEKGKEPTPNKKLSLLDEMRVAFSTIFQSNSTEKELKIFYAAEIDGYDSNDKIVEAKTQAYKLYNGPWFGTKAMKWWLQCALIGVDDIIVGLRTNKGIVFKVQKVTLKELDRNCNEWDGNVCFNTFQHVMNLVRDKYDELVQPNELLLIEKKYNIIEYSIVSKNDYPEQVLTNEFKDRFKK